MCTSSCFGVTIAACWYSFPLKLNCCSKQKKSKQIIPLFDTVKCWAKKTKFSFDRELKTGGLRGLKHCCNEFGFVDYYYFHWNRSKYDVLFECLTGNVFDALLQPSYISTFFRVSYTTRKLFFLTSWSSYKITVHDWINPKVQVF